MNIRLICTGLGALMTAILAERHSVPHGSAQNG